MSDSPIEAILAEVLSPQLYRRWLVLQGHRVFTMEDGELAPHGYYLLDALGTDLPVLNDLTDEVVPLWLVRVRDHLNEWLDGVDYALYGAWQAIRHLDAILAGLPDVGAAHTQEVGHD